MIKRLRYMDTTGTNPYENLALEELLLHTVEPEEVILYLWQNRNTVVIGRNQSCRSECRLAALEEDGGFLARRLSGGGAVYHDLGNLNFTFLVRSADYDLERQLSVILGGVQLLGLAARQTGRNDITIEGRKFSGNAFYRTGDRQYHHGTVMVEADLEKLSRYLTVAPDKLATKGVKSVRSRVVNLRELNPAITLERVRSALITAFKESYKLSPQPMEEQRLDRARLAELTEKYSSAAWRLGNEPDSTTTFTHRFPWGGVELRLLLCAGQIGQAALFTDAMEAELAPAVEQLLTGAAFTSQGLKAALLRGDIPENTLAPLLGDICGAMEEYYRGTF